MSDERAEYLLEDSERCVIQAS